MPYTNLEMSSLFTMMAVIALGATHNDMAHKTIQADPQSSDANDGNKDADLARALARRGWFDLALEVCDRLEKTSGRATEARDTASLARADIYGKMADAEADVEKAKQLFDDAASILKDLSKAPPSSARGLESRTLAGALLWRKAKLLFNASDSEENSGLASHRRTEADRAYGDVQKHLENVIAEFEKVSQPSEILREAIGDLHLDLPQILYERATISGKSEKEKNDLLIQALKILSFHTYFISPRGTDYEVSLREGRCFLELGRYKEAERALRDGLSLEKDLARAGLRPAKYQSELASAAYLSLAQLVNRPARPPEAA